MGEIDNPKVTIHVPVYNGENYLKVQLDSLLNQTFQDFELLITDNCSTDGTREICEHYVKMDPRVRYILNDQNIGPTANFDSGVDLARGKYFKWAAHDDFHDPRFLQVCVDVLDADDDVALVQTLVAIVDENGETLSIYDSNLDGADSDDPVERFKPLIHIRHVCTEMFGLFRLEALKKTDLQRSNFHASDRVMLAETSLVGKIKQVKEPYFFNREHEQRYVRRFKPSERDAHYVRRSTSKSPVDHLMLYRHYKSAINTYLSDQDDRKRARKILFQWWFVEWNFLRLVIQLAARKFPQIYDGAKWVSDRALKPKHPTIISNKNS